MSVPPSSAFTLSELRRVGTAATMIVVCGTLIILAMVMMMGHYNSLAHSGPKAVLDGAVIALLIGRRGRWRCLTLLGTVYGLVLLLQIGVIYLLPVMALAALLAAGAGRAVDLVNRSAALLVAAIVYEIVAGFGAPIKIYFGTGGKSEPFLWGLWFAEWPLRIAGAAIGVWLARRWQTRRRMISDRDTGILPVRETPAQRKMSNPAERHRDDPLPQQRKTPARTDGTWPAALRIVMCIIACIVPMGIESIAILAAMAGIYVIYALWAGMRWRVLHAFLGLIWGWVIFGILSYAWNQDMNRVVDLARTLVLRFTPLALASMVLVATVRPVDLIRLLRKFRVSGAVLIPMSSVVRSIPQSRRMFRDSIDILRAQGHWTGPMSLFRRPGRVIRGLLGPQVKRWASELAEDAAPPSRR